MPGRSCVGELKAPDKPFDISKRAVWEAYEKVRANKGAPGVDKVSLAEFEKDLKNNLYKIWNRMSSGSYFHLRCGRSRYRSRMAAGPARSGFPPLRTESPRRWSRGYWNGRPSRSSTPTHMATGRGGRRSTRSQRAAAAAGATTG